jgi:hypothetical protein
MSYKANAPDIFIAIFFAEPQTLAQVLPHQVAIQSFHSLPSGLEGLGHGLPDRGFARTAQPR